MKVRWLWTVAGIGLAAALVLGYRLLRPRPLPAGILYANGQLEATEVRLSAEVTGRVLQSRIVEGRAVEAGEVLAQLDRSDLEARLAQAQDRARAIGQADDALAQQLGTWRHHLMTASRDLERVRALRQRGVASQRTVDQAANAFEEARGRVGSLEARIRESGAQLAAAKREMELLQLQLDKTAIRAPISGTIITKGVEIGELASPGRVVAVLADLSRLDLRVFIPEREIGKVSLGDPARVRVDAFPERTFPATVSKIDDRAQFTPREVLVPEERVRMVFGITLSVPNAEGVMKPGMPADAWLRWSKDAAWPDHLWIPR